MCRQVPHAPRPERPPRRHATELASAASPRQSRVPPGIHYHICVRILLHMFPHTRICVVILTEQSPPRYALLHMCPHLLHICVRILRYLCRHTSRAESRPPRYSVYRMCPHTTTYVSAYYYICVRILLLYMCRHTNRAESPQRPSKTKTPDLRAKSPDLRAHSPPKTPQRTPAMRKPEAGANSLPAGGVGASASASAAGLRCPLFNIQ